MKIWTISDTHWNHVNILKYENRPVDHVQQIIKNWQGLVQPEDLVIHLGDVIFAEDKEKNLKAILAELPGKKILCRGNHDSYPEAKWAQWEFFMNCGFDAVTDYFIYDNMAFSHAPLTPLPMQGLYNYDKPVDLNIHGHFHRTAHRVPREGENGEVFVDQFYDYKYYKANEEKYKLIQIEDELRPFSLEEVLAR